MVAYSFMSQFAAPIVAGTKGGTIRDDRKRHARAGEELQLYQGMRTRQCRLIARKICLGVEPIRLRLIGCVAVAGATYHRAPQLDAFAVFDGFPDWAALRDFWREKHGEIPVFNGQHIRWAPWPDELTERAA